VKSVVRYAFAEALLYAEMSDPKLFATWVAAASFMQLGLTQALAMAEAALEPVARRPAAAKIEVRMLMLLLLALGFGDVCAEWTK